MNANPLIRWTQHNLAVASWRAGLPPGDAQSVCMCETVNLALPVCCDDAETIQTSAAVEIDIARHV